MDPRGKSKNPLNDTSDFLTLRQHHEDVMLEEESAMAMDDESDEQTVMLESPREAAPVTDSSHQPFAGGYVQISGKIGGANNAGTHGAVWGIPDPKNEGKFIERAMFKRDTVIKGSGKRQTQKVRVGKIIGECVAGNMLAGMMQHMHPEDPNYAEKYVAKVSLVKARPAAHEKNDEATLTYLKSIFLRNYTHDFWKAAFIEHYGNKFAQRYSRQYAEALRRDSLADSADNIRSVAKNAAKDKIEEEHSGKPKQIVPALLKRYEDETIQRPMEMLEQHRQMFTDFCEQTAARILLADYGVHTGNFGVIDDKTGVLRMGSIDFGAAFCKLPPDVEPYSRKKAEIGTKFYKNHLLEYHPNLNKSEEMAKAFIRVGGIDQAAMNDIIKSGLNSIRDSGTYQDPVSLKKFCRRMGMPKDVYVNTNTLPKLYEAMESFMRTQLALRQKSILNKGYGMLVEHCMEKEGFNYPKLQLMMQEFPGLARFIKSADFMRHDLVLEEKYTDKPPLDNETRKHIVDYLRMELQDITENFRDVKYGISTLVTTINALDRKFDRHPNLTTIREFTAQDSALNASYEKLSKQLAEESKKAHTSDNILILRHLKNLLEAAKDIYQGLSKKITKYMEEQKRKIQEDTRTNIESLKRSSGTFKPPTLSPKPPPRTGSLSTLAKGKSSSPTAPARKASASTLGRSMPNLSKKVTSAPTPSTTGMYGRKSSKTVQGSDQVKEKQNKGTNYSPKKSGDK